MSAVFPSTAVCERVATLLFTRENAALKIEKKVAAEEPSVV